MNIVDKDYLVDRSQLSENEILIAVSVHEFSLLVGGLNEALDSVDPGELETRIGVSRATAGDVCARAAHLLRSVDGSVRGSD